MKLRRFLFALALLVAAPVRADDYAVAEDKSVWLRALLDLRIVRRGRRRAGWIVARARLRYGGVVDGTGSFERVTRFAISQFALEPGGAAVGTCGCTRR